MFTILRAFLARNSFLFESTLDFWSKIVDAAHLTAHLCTTMHANYALTNHAQSVHEKRFVKHPFPYVLLIDYVNEGAKQTNCANDDVRK